MSTREPAVAGTFYPGTASALKGTVLGLLEAAASSSIRRPKALIVPHAGYPYSGPIAASAYRLLETLRAEVSRVILLGPAHRVYLEGMAVPTTTSFLTPLGEVELDRTSIERLLTLPGVSCSDSAHALEHSLEVQLPFLQVALDDFLLVPIVVGQSDPHSVAAALELLWGGEETLIVVSSDLSHYHPYAAARSIDADTSRAIEQRATTLGGEEACGARGINGLMVAARDRELEVTTLDLRNSGDTAGDRGQVVGYGAYALA